jgi:hypothetical protein
MTSRQVTVPFLISLGAVPVVFAIAVAAGGASAGDKVTLWLFGATVLVELVVLVKAFSARKMFSSSDPLHLTWTLIVGFLVIRLMAEARLSTLNFGLVPRYTEGGSDSLFFYVIVLRYLYTVSDLLFIGALISTIKTYKATGFKFELIGLDYVYMALLWVMPVITFAFRDNLIYSNQSGTDGYIGTYRLVTVTVGALIATLCLVVRRYAIQMGGGAVSRVWNAVVAAGIARDASFLVLALLSSLWRPGAAFIEQFLLWIFSCCWLIATLLQQEVLPRARIQDSGPSIKDSERMQEVGV